MNAVGGVGTAAYGPDERPALQTCTSESDQPVVISQHLLNLVYVAAALASASVTHSAAWLTEEPVAMARSDAAGSPPDRWASRTATGASETSCVTCHQRTGHLSHPVGVAVTSTARPADPEGLPLLPGGLVGCTTCHDPVRAARVHRDGGNDPALRMPAISLCAECHSAAAPLASGLGHALRLGRAHLTTDEYSGFSHGLDTESRFCLSCHDGSVAGTSRVREAGPWSRRTSHFVDFSAQHPVGVSYGRQGLRGGPSQLRPAVALHSSIRLFDDQVGCGSCHSVYAKTSDLLVGSETSNGLCLECHIK